MKVFLCAGLVLGLSASAHAAEPKPKLPKQWPKSMGQSPMQQTVDFRRSTDCVSMATFNKVIALVGKNGVAPGLKQDQIPRAQRLVVSQGVCRAYAEQDQAPCDQLKGLGLKPASLSCRSEPHLLEAHRDFYGGNMQGAMEACVRWYDTRREQLSPMLQSDQLCKTVFEEMQANPKDACTRIGEKVRSMLGRKTALGITRLCRTYIDPSPAHCSQKGRGESPDICLARYRVIQALKQKNPAACPSHPLFSGICRAMFSEDPKATCNGIVLDLMHLYCGR